MHFHFVLDEPQYNSLFEALIAEARGRRHTVTTGLRCVHRYDADAYVSLQDVALRAAPRPRVFLTHGLGLAKRGALTLDVDLLLLPYSGKGIIDDQQHMSPERRSRTTVVRSLGSPKIDLLQRGAARKAEIQRQMRATYGFDARPIVGYCPTFRHDGSLHHAQRGHRLREAEAILEQRFNVVMLTHSLETDAAEVAELRFRASPTLSRLDHFLGLDCAVTDTSGIGFELCAIDMPMVLLDNPAEPDFLLARMLEQPVRVDYGPVCTLANLANTVAFALSHPAAHASRRAFWAEMAFGPRDGQAARRTIDAIEAFVLAQHRHFAVRRGESTILQDYLANGMTQFRTAGAATVEREAVTVPLTGTGRWAFYGPYQKLGIGRFALEIDADADGEGPFCLQVDAQGGHTILAQLEFTRRLHASLLFEVPEALAGVDLEFRLTQPAGVAGRLRLKAFRLHLIGLPGTGGPALAAARSIPAPAPLNPAWQDVATLLQDRAAAADRVVAPAPFHPWLAHCRQVSDAPEPGEWPDLVVLHKGELSRLPPDFLPELARRAAPIFANAVFVVWRLHPGFAAGDRDGPLHLASLQHFLRTSTPPALSFPYQDRAWAEVAEFLAGHAAVEELVLAPAPFRQVLALRLRQAEQPAAGVEYAWVVLHKGRLEQMPLDFLRALPADHQPVLANAVFVVWCRRPRPGMEDCTETPHVRSFTNRLRVLEMAETAG
jgi:hypothetical protein